MRINSRNYKGISYEYQYEGTTLHIYNENTEIVQIKIVFDERFTERTLQYFGDVLYEAFVNRVQLVETACHAFIENGLFDYDESTMWRKWE